MLRDGTSKKIEERGAFGDKNNLKKSQNEKNLKGTLQSRQVCKCTKQFQARAGT